MCLRVRPLVLKMKSGTISVHDRRPGGSRYKIATRCPFVTGQVHKPCVRAQSSAHQHAPPRFWVVRVQFCRSFDATDHVGGVTRCGSGSSNEVSKDTSPKPINHVQLYLCVRSRTPGACRLSKASRYFTQRRDSIAELKVDSIGWPYWS